MERPTEELLREWAKTYNTKKFIEDDPIEFPHRYTDRLDIEVSAFISSWIAFGMRSQIRKKAGLLHSVMTDGPYAWIMSDDEHKLKAIEQLRATAATTKNTNVCYRFFTYDDYLMLCGRLKSIYSKYKSLEDALPEAEGANAINKLQYLFRGIAGIPKLNGDSACKRLAMFLRWMVRADGIVDFGLWRTHVTPKDLIIPLDVHVYNSSRELGLITHTSVTMNAAIKITEALRKIFPDDPCAGDFALFGYGVNK